MQYVFFNRKILTILFSFILAQLFGQSNLQEQVDKDFIHYRYNYENTGYIPITSPIKYAHPLWAYKTIGHVLGTPISVDGWLYFGDSKNFVYCVDGNTGDTIWVKKLNIEGLTKGISNSPVVYKNNIIVVNGDGYVVWINRYTGNIKEEKIYLKAPVYSTPVLVQNYLFITTLGEGYIWLIDAETGERYLKQNQISTGFPIYSTPIVNINPSSQFNLSKNKNFFEVIITVQSRVMFFYIQIEPDRVRQLKDVLIEGAIVSSPVQQEYKIFFATRQRLYCIDQFSFEILWVRKVEGRLLHPLKKVYYTPVTNGKVIYHGDRGYDIKTGSAVYHVWNYAKIKTDLLLTKDSLIMSGEYTLFDKTRGYIAGLSVHSANINFWTDLYSFPLASPILANDKLYITTEDRDIIALQ